MLLRVVHWPPCLVHLGKKRFWKQSWQYCRRCRNFGLCLSAFFSIISFEPFFFPQSILAHLISGFPSTTSHKSLSYYSLFSTHHPSALFPFFPAISPLLSPAHSTHLLVTLSDTPILLSCSKYHTALVIVRPACVLNLYFLLSVYLSAPLCPSRTQFLTFPPPPPFSFLIVFYPPTGMALLQRVFEVLTFPLIWAWLSVRSGAGV